MNNLKKGVFIVFEGGESCGKSTQHKLCKNYFSKDYNVVTMIEPGSNPVSKSIREELLHKHEDIEPLCEVMLYEAARAQFMEHNLKPAIEQKKLILGDRFYYSTIAYQGFGGNLDVKFIESLNKKVSQNIKADLLFILDISYEEAMNRMKVDGKQLDRMERKGKEFHERVRAGYHYIAKNYKEAIMIDGSRKKEDINKQIVSIIGDYLSSNGHYF